MSPQRRPSRRFLLTEKLLMRPKGRSSCKSVDHCLGNKANPAGRAAESAGIKRRVFADYQPFGNVDATVYHDAPQSCSPPDITMRQNNGFIQRRVAMGANTGKKQAAA